RTARCAHAKKSRPVLASSLDHAARKFPWRRQATVGRSRTLPPAHPETQSALGCWKRVQEAYVERLLPLAPSKKEDPTIRLFLAEQPIRTKAKWSCGRRAQWNVASAPQIHESIRPYRQEVQYGQVAALPARKDQQCRRAARTGLAFRPFLFAH